MTETKPITAVREALEQAVVLAAKCWRSDVERGRAGLHGDSSTAGNTVLMDAVDALIAFEERRGQRSPTP